MRTAISAVFFFVLVACAVAEESTGSSPSLPDIAKCEAEYVPIENGPIPGNPLPIGEEFSAIATTGPSSMAVATLSGETVCTDILWVSQINEMELLQAARFLGFDWWGEESFGYRLVDRAGSTVLDTGAKPAFSPSGNLMASIQLSDSGWGEIESFVIWAVEPKNLDEIYRLPEGVWEDWHIDGYFDHRIESWDSEDCVQMSATNEVALERTNGNFQTARRIAHYSAESEDWEIKPGLCPKS